MNDALINSGINVIEQHERSGVLAQEQFDSFWFAFKKNYLSEEKKDSSSDLSRNNLLIKYTAIQEKIKAFYEEIKLITLTETVFFWLKGIAQDVVWGKYYGDSIDKIVKKGFLILSKDGKNRTIGDFSFSEHLEILENIRCVKEWGDLEKEKIINCYLQFSHYLSKMTERLIPAAYDPDRDRVNSKILTYERFTEFVQHLSTRDALIAKLLYFGAPSLDEVVSLRIQDIDFHFNKISFVHQVVDFPKHVIVGIKELIQHHGEPNAFVFVNGKGNPVERTHLPHSFARASMRKEGDIKITPAVLLQKR